MTDAATSAAWGDGAVTAAPAPAGPAAYARLHADALARLRAWRASEAGQERLRRDYLTHLARHPDAMARSGPPEHLTGSVLVLDAAGTNVLLTHHPKADLWFQFGGHFEVGDASMWHGATREAVEESGIVGLEVLPEIVDLSRHALAASFGRCREHLDVRYMAVAPAGAEHAVSPESLDVRWWPADDLPDRSPADLRPLVDRARRLLRC